MLDTYWGHQMVDKISWDDYDQVIISLFFERQMLS